jgi:hypothetical protein
MIAAGMPDGPGDVDRPVSSSPESLLQIGWRRVDEIGSPWPGIRHLTGPLLPMMKGTMLSSYGCFLRPWKTVARWVVASSMVRRVKSPRSRIVPSSAKSCLVGELPVTIRCA